MSERKNQKQQFWVILTIVFVGFIGISMPYLIFPPLFLNPEFSFLSPEWSSVSRALFLGITLAAYPLGAFIGSPILGALSDDYGRKYLLSGSLVITALCNLLTAFAIENQMLWLLILSRWGAGFMEGNIAIARAMCADLKLLSKHETFGRMNAGIAIAYLIGPLVGAVMTDKNLFEELSTSTPFYMISILFIVLAGLSAWMLKKSVATPSEQKKTLLHRFSFFQRVFANKQVKVLLIASTCFTLAVDIFYQFSPVYLTVKWTLTPTQLILYNGVLCVALAIGNGWLPGFLSTRMSNRPLILGSIAGFALIILAMVLSNSHLWMVVWYALIGLMIGTGVTLLTVKISDAVSDAVQGEVLGTQMSLRVLGDGIICLIGGALLILSPKIILVVAAGLSAAAILYYRHQTKRKTAS